MSILSQYDTDFIYDLLLFSGKFFHAATGVTTPLTLRWACVFRQRLQVISWKFVVTITFCLPQATWCFFPCM